VTLPWILPGAAVGMIEGPRIRASVFTRSSESGQPLCHACPACDQKVRSGRWFRRSPKPPRLPPRVWINQSAATIETEVNHRRIKPPVPQRD
jgi:hypothetical protein